MEDFVLVAFLSLVFIAACEDLWRYRISNVLCGTLLLLFPVAAVLADWQVNWLSHLAAGAIMFAFGLGIFAARLMGGGDIKLMSVIALWAGLAALPPLLLATCLSSLAVVVALLVVRAVPASTGAGRLPRPKFARRGAPVPFAVPVAIASYACINLFPAFSQ